MMIERTSYWPKEDRLEEVLALRREACRVRAALDLPMGVILIERTGQSPHQIVHWECRFADSRTHSADLRARAESEAFNRVRTSMQTVISEFRRSICEEVSEQAGALHNASVAAHAIVPREVCFCSDGRDLAGYLYLPPGRGPFPCLVTNHGSTIEHETSDVCRPGSAAVYLQWGIASFLPHRRGYGNSPGEPWRTEVDAVPGSARYDQRLTARLEAESDDVVAAIRHVGSRAEIDADHIGVIGSSFGGTVSLLAAEKCDRLRCLIEFAGAAMNWEQAPILRDRMLEAARRLEPPAFFIQAENDYSTAPTVALAQARDAVGKPVRQRIYPPFGLTRDEGHFFYGDGSRVWGPDVRKFLERWL